MTRPRALMIQGTGSDAGKSLVVAGLCRALHRRGIAVRPFKAQNMSNNAAVTPDGGEIGRAQALQARACGVEPTVEMNPILLKPEGERGSQVVLRGRMAGTLRAGAFRARHGEFLEAARASFLRLSEEAEIVVVEGAGSASEVNLRAGDVANMGFAEALNLPVVLVADIHRGGVIANLVGTAAVLTEADRARVKGYIVNRFRGDPALFESGLETVTARTGWRSFGILPFWPEAGRLPAEDSVVLETARSVEDRPIRVGVPLLPRISNFDDLDPLAQEPDVSLQMIRAGEALPGNLDLVVLPGSKSTMADLAFFREQGWDIDLAGHVRRGGLVLGLCGGFQMLGRTLADPAGIEGNAGHAEGLGYLALDTVLTPEKSLRRVSGREVRSGAAVEGYEMHIGRSEGLAMSTPLLTVDGRGEGAVSADGRVMGSYLHGLFAADAFRHAFLERLHAGRAPGASYEAGIERTLDGLAEHLEAHLDVEGLWALATQNR